MALYEMKDGKRVMVHCTQPQQPPVNTEQSAAPTVVDEQPTVDLPSQSQAADSNGEPESSTKRKKQGGDK